jgi:hypothetical protein
MVAKEDWEILRNRKQKFKTIMDFFGDNLKNEYPEDEEMHS